MLWESLNRLARARDRGSAPASRPTIPVSPHERGDKHAGNALQRRRHRGRPRIPPAPRRMLLPRAIPAPGGSGAASPPLPPRGCRTRHLLHRTGQGRDGDGQCLPVPRAPSPSDRPPGAAATGSRRRCRRELSEGRCERRGRRGSAPPPPAPDRPRADPPTFLTTYPRSRGHFRSGRGGGRVVAPSEAGSPPFRHLRAKCELHRDLRGHSVRPSER